MTGAIESASAAAIVWNRSVHARLKDIVPTENSKFAAALQAIESCNKYAARVKLPSDLSDLSRAIEKVLKQQPTGLAPFELARVWLNQSRVFHAIKALTVADDPTTKGLDPELLANQCEKYIDLLTSRYQFHIPVTQFFKSVFGVPNLDQELTSLLTDCHAFLRTCKKEMSSHFRELGGFVSPVFWNEFPGICWPVPEIVAISTCEDPFAEGSTNSVMLEPTEGIPGLVIAFLELARLFDPGKKIDHDRYLEFFVREIIKAYAFESTLGPKLDIPRQLAHLLTWIHSTESIRTLNSNGWLSKLMNGLRESVEPENKIAPPIRDDLYPILDDCKYEVEKRFQTESREKCKCEVVFAVENEKPKITPSFFKDDWAIYQNDWKQGSRLSQNVELQQFKTRAESNLYGLKPVQSFVQMLIEADEGNIAGLNFHNLFTSVLSDPMALAFVRSKLEQANLNVHPLINWDSGQVRTGPELLNYSGASRSVTSGPPPTEWEINVERFSLRPDNAKFEYRRPLDPRLRRLFEAKEKVPDALKEIVSEFCTAYEVANVSSHSAGATGDWPQIALRLADEINKCFRDNKLDPDSANRLQKALFDACLRSTIPLSIQPSNWDYTDQSKFTEEISLDVVLEFTNLGRETIYAVRKFGAVYVNGSGVMKGEIVVSAGQLKGYSEIVAKLSERQSNARVQKLLRLIEGLPQIHFDNPNHIENPRLLEAAYARIFETLYPGKKDVNEAASDSDASFDDVIDWYKMTVESLKLYKIVVPKEGDRLLPNWKIEIDYEEAGRNGPQCDHIGRVYRPLLKFYNGHKKLGAIFDVKE